MAVRDDDAYLFVSGTYISSTHLFMIDASTFMVIKSINTSTTVTLSAIIAYTYRGNLDNIL